MMHWFTTSKPQIIWIFFSLIVLSLFVGFLLVNLQASDFTLIMPLDDVYIHFQYAQQLADGQPYIYNPGQPPTSGATSFLYPYVLALGNLIGFQELKLGLWAMLIGAAAFLFSLVAIFKICESLNLPASLGLLTATLFAFTGLFPWHFFSGMETGFVVAFALWTAYFFIVENRWKFIITASLMALIRPEASIMAMIAAGLMLVKVWLKEHRNLSIVFYGSLLIPIAMIALQPLINYLITGTAVASGNSSKSLLGIIPSDYSLIIGRILDNFSRMWWELFIGYSNERGIFLLPLCLMPTALIGLTYLLRKRRYRWLGVLLLLWLVLISGAISTLDTAFWHFRRYQIPLVALCFPVAMLGYYRLYQFLNIRKERHPFRWSSLIPFIWSFSSLLILANFLHLYHVNVDYVYRQPYQMALWLQENTPEEAVIAVHDVGMMRYYGKRNTLDIVGLTTADAADYWRNGPGAVGEFLLLYRPDYIASYGRGHGYGLYMLADTPIYGEPIITFPIKYWQRQANVALATDIQAIYQPNWDKLSKPMSIFPYAEYDVLTSIDVAQIQSEADVEYQWSSRIDSGFITEIYNFPHAADSRVHFVDGLRRINGTESFQFTIDPLTLKSEKSLILLSRIHPEQAGIIDIYANDSFVDRQWIPEMPGNWLDIATEIGIESLDTSPIIRIEPHIPSGSYQPAYHTLVATTMPDFSVPDEVIASYQDDQFQLLETAIEQTENHLVVDLAWFSTGQAEGDYRFFIHLYDEINQPPVLQHDAYPYENSLPPGNWLPGILNDQIHLNIENIPAGMYQLAIGFYNPYTQERLMPVSDNSAIITDGRLFLDEVEIINHGG